MTNNMVAAAKNKLSNLLSSNNILLTIIIGLLTTIWLDNKATYNRMFGEQKIVNSEFKTDLTETTKKVTCLEQVTFEHGTRLIKVEEDVNEFKHKKNRGL